MPKMPKKQKRSAKPPYYSAVTLANEEICGNISSLDKCLKLVKEYQLAHGNPMCKVFVHEIIKRHLEVVKPT